MKRLLLAFLLLATPAAAQVVPVPGTPPIDILMARSQALELLEELAAIPQVSCWPSPAAVPPIVCPTNPGTAELLSLMRHLEYLLDNGTGATSVTLY